MAEEIIRLSEMSERHRAVLAGSEGKAAATAMEILLALGRIFGADRFAPVASAQISGVSYRNLSDAGLEFLESFAADGRVAVPSMLNPAGMDLVDWRSMGVDDAFARKQQRVIDAFVRMGVAPTCTCTPYLAGHAPRPGEILAWGESSAVTYVNSVIGARSNREGGPAALAAAIIGETPLCGLHLDENRRPQVTVNLRAALRAAADYGALGAALGERAGGKIPLVRSGFEPSPAGLRALSAALPTYAGVSLFHWEDVTPEWRQRPPAGEEISIDADDIASAFGRWGGSGSPADLIFVGCPHLGIEEIEYIARRLEGRRTSVPLWACTSRSVAREAQERGLLDPIRRAGGRIICDTCLVVGPLPGNVRSVMTDSAKGCYYLSGAHGIEVALASLDDCLDRATGRV
jgi:predicted aconitase